MARPLRIEFPGAIYHVTSRGDRREPIFVDDNDRHALLAVLEQALARFGAHTLAYCLMGNHYHLVLCTRQGNLSALMRHLNGVFTQAFNGIAGVRSCVLPDPSKLPTYQAILKASARRPCGRGRRDEPDGLV